MKPFWKSKLVILGVLQLAAAITLFISNQLDETPAWNASEIFLLANGIITIVLRWFTDQPITSFFKGADKLRPKIMERKNKITGSE